MAVRLSGCLMLTASVFPHNKINIKYFLLISSELQEPSTLLYLPAVIIIVTITVKIILMDNQNREYQIHFCNHPLSVDCCSVRNPTNSLHLQVQVV